MSTSTLDVPCPACQAQGLTYTAEQIDLPYLGESLETLMICQACGYKHVDFILLDSKEPTRWSYKITEERDMVVRVVRSSSGTMRIPELGISIEPGTASEAFISNIEGIIVRVEKVLSQLHNDGDNREKVEELQKTLQDMREGLAPPVTLIIEDPFGNSSILAEKAVSEPIPEEEAAHLKTGMFVFNQD